MNSVRFCKIALQMDNHASKNRIVISIWFKINAIMESRFNANGKIINVGRNNVLMYFIRLIVLVILLSLT